MPTIETTFISPQGSAYKWFERREAETPSVIREPDPDALPRLTSITVPSVSRSNWVGRIGTNIRSAISQAANATVSAFH
jgi:hypothetical protein